MTLTAIDLSMWLESVFLRISDEQKRTILERFGTEPDLYEWNEQDIAIQIRNYLGCGEFVKTNKDDSERFLLPFGIAF